MNATTKNTIIAALLALTATTASAEFGDIRMNPNGYQMNYGAWQNPGIGSSFMQGALIGQQLRMQQMQMEQLRAMQAAREQMELERIRMANERAAVDRMNRQPKTDMFKEAYDQMVREGKISGQSTLPAGYELDPEQR